MSCRFAADFCASADCGWVHWTLVSLCPLHCLSALLMALKTSVVKGRAAVFCFSVKWGKMILVRKNGTW